MKRFSRFVVTAACATLLFGACVSKPAAPMPATMQTEAELDFVQKFLAVSLD